MKKIKKAKPITNRDIAKFLNVEQEYNDILLEQELDEEREKFIQSDFEDIHHSINSNKKNER